MTFPASRGTMEHRIVYQDSNGVRRTMVTDDAAPGELRVVTQMDLEPVLQSVQRDRDNINLRNYTGNRMLARVPMTIYEQSIHEQWDEDRWKKWLNDPDNEPFRVWKGRV